MDKKAETNESKIHKELEDFYRQQPKEALIQFLVTPLVVLTMQHCIRTYGDKELHDIPKRFRDFVRELRSMKEYYKTQGSAAVQASKVE